MKILFLIDDKFPFGRGGASTVLRRLALAFKKRGHKIIVITPEKEGPKDFQGIKIYNINARYSRYILRSYFGLYNPLAISKIKKILREERPDIVHAQTIAFYLSWACLKLAQKYTKGVFFTAHDVLAFTPFKLTHFIPGVVGRGLAPTYGGSYNYRLNWKILLKQAGKAYNPFRNLMIRHYLRYCNKIFAVSQTLKEALEQNKISNLEVIYNGINIDDWQVADESIYNFKLNLKLEDKKIIFFGGRLSGSKGGEEILKALKLISQKIKNVILLVVGEKGFYTKKMEELSCKLGVLDKIIFTGWLEKEDLKAAYSSSNVIVTPSLCLDTFNLVNIEAMALKKPVVGTCFGGTPEIVVDQETGYIVNPLDIHQLAKKIGELLENKEKAQRFGENGFERVKEKFSLEKQVDKIESWHKEALSIR